MHERTGIERGFGCVERGEISPLKNLPIGISSAQSNDFFIAAIQSAAS